MKFKNFIFGYVIILEFQICCCVPNFVKIGYFFVEIWRFNDLQYGGRPPFYCRNLDFVSHTCPLSPCDSASQCKFSLKSDNRLLSCGQTTISNIATVRHLEFKKKSFQSSFHMCVASLSLSFKSAFVYQISSKSDNFCLEI